jgi:hypothetical protein
MLAFNRPSVQRKKIIMNNKETPRQAADRLLQNGEGYQTEDGNLILNHKAVEKLAFLYDIEVKVELVTNNFERKSAIIRGTAKNLSTSRVYQSFGEVHPQTNDFNYYIGVCEKRAADRAILKCLGLHGDFMSEIENEKEFIKKKIQTHNNNQSTTIILKDEKLKKEILSQTDKTNFDKLLIKNSQWLEQLGENKSEEDFLNKLSALQIKLEKGAKPNGRN